MEAGSFPPLKLTSAGTGVELLTGTTSCGLSMYPEPPSNAVAGCEEGGPDSQRADAVCPFRTQTWVSRRFHPLKLEL